VTKKRPRKDDIPPATMELLLEKNWADILLYRYAQSIYAEKIKLEGSDFAGEVNYYRTLKHTFKAAEKLSEEGYTEESLAMMQMILKTEPLSPDLHRESGKLFLRAGNIENAIQTGSELWN